MSDKATMRLGCAACSLIVALSAACVQAQTGVFAKLNAAQIRSCSDAHLFDGMAEH